MPEPLSTPSNSDLTTSEESSTASPLLSMASLSSSLMMDPSLVYQPTTPPVYVSATSKGSSHRDSSWLELEICSEYLNQGCPRGELCCFAHPHKGTLIDQGGKLTCCYDFLKDRCHRDHCKYFHPPPHIKEQLVTAGKQFGAMMSGFYPVPAYQQTLPVAPGMPSQYGEYGVLPAQFTGDKLSICRDYLTGQCSQSLCHLVHPEHYVRRNHDGTVTMCRDFARSTGCPREQCRFYHPPAHIQELIRPAGLFAPPQGMQQSMFMPTLMGPGFQQSTPLYYSPTASTTTFMYLPGSFPGGSSPVFVPVSYPTNIFPLPSPLPAQSVSSSSGGGETFLQTIVSHQTIQH